MTLPSVFVDTSFVIAMVNASDRHHERATALDAKYMTTGHRLVLHWGVLTEIADGFARLHRRAKAFTLIRRMLTEPAYQVYCVDENLLQKAIELYCSRPDKEWGLTDCISFVLMQSLNIGDALTADTHFVQAGFRALLLEP